LGIDSNKFDDLMEECDMSEKFHYVDWNKMHHSLVDSYGGCIKYNDDDGTFELTHTIYSNKYNLYSFILDNCDYSWITVSWHDIDEIPEDIVAIIAETNVNINKMEHDSDCNYDSFDDYDLNIQKDAIKIIWKCWCDKKKKIMHCNILKHLINDMSNVVLSYL
jgi:hypothetical protein